MDMLHNRPALIADLGAIIDELDAKGRLIRIKSKVNSKHDLVGIATEYEGGGSAVLFENVEGYDVPVFIGLYWSRELLADLFSYDELELPQYIADRIGSWHQNPIYPEIVMHGPVLEIIESEVDLGKIPIPVHALGDAGPYLDAAVVITKDPETSIRNTSIQRFLVIDKNTLAINIDSGRHLELCLNKAAQRGQDLHLTINIGVGPGLHFAASAPAEAAPFGTDELGIACAFHGEPLRLAKGYHSRVEIIADAMYALECSITPGDLIDEGPFAEVTGNYAYREPRPRVKVISIHHRRKPIFHSILPGKEVHNSVGLLGETNVLNLLQKQIPGVKDVYFSHGGCGFYHAIVQISQVRAGWGKQAIMAAFAAFPPLKMVTVVDDDVDIRNPSDVEWAMATRLDGKSGILQIEEAFGHGLNPTFDDYIGTKIGFNATRPFPFSPQFDRVEMKKMDISKLRIRDKKKK